MKQILSVLTLVFASLLCFSQQDQPIPTDKNTRVGKLSNGLTYYIRHNALPKDRADFYIAQRVGSVLEEESQRGLAHFLEHMAFNGLENLPGKTMINYLEKIGVKFGENLNASTGFDQTNYLITNVPTTRQGIIDTCLLILHDWSSFISLNEEEIDNERGVIREEWRTRNGAGIRSYESILPIVFQGSQYGNRMPIGLIEVIETFPYQVLRDYYDKWYRPDLQAIIIVGDIDVDAIEAKIKKMFADIEPNINPAERTQFEVPTNEEPIVAIYTDPEETTTKVSIFQKHDVYPADKKNSLQYYKDDYINDLIISMINTRLSDMTKKASNPFSNAYFYDGQFMVAKTKDAYTMIGLPKDGEIMATIDALVLELKKISEFGFNASELEIAKAKLISYLEAEFNEKGKQKNSYYVRQCINNFQNNEPLSSIEFRYNFIRQFEAVTSLEAVNKIAMQNTLNSKDMVITITGPKKDGIIYPTEKEVLAAIEAAKGKEVTSYAEIINKDPLISKNPKAGKIKSSKELKDFGATEWTLSNGAVVVFKKTDFKANEIRFEAISKGGMSLAINNNINTVKMVNNLYGIGGLGKFDKSTLDKKIAGKNTSVNAFIGTYTEGIRGYSTPKDIETMMQLIYLNFTSIRQDQEAFEAEMSKLRSALKNQDADPRTTIKDSIASVLYGNHPLKKTFKFENLSDVNYKQALEIYKARFENAGDFVFFFIGNIDEESFKPLVETYIGSLPSSKHRDNWKDINAGIKKGDVKCHYEKQLEVSKSTVNIVYSGDVVPTAENRIKMSVLQDLLRIIYTEKVREEEGGTYGVGVAAKIISIPTPEYSISIGFDTNPEMKDKLIGIIHAQIDRIAEIGPNQKDLDKVRENKIKKYKEITMENSYWGDIMSDFYMESVNINNNYENIVNSITVESMKQFVNELFQDKNVKEVVQSSK